MKDEVLGKLIFLLLILESFRFAEISNFSKQINFIKNEIKDNVLIRNLDKPEVKKKLKNFIKMNLINFLSSKEEQNAFSKTKSDYSDYAKYFSVMYPTIMKIDEISSHRLLKKMIINKTLITKSVLDVAAGDGRVTKNVLSKYFEEIDAVEPIKYLAEKIIDMKKNNDKIKNVYISKIENFNFMKKYDLIWSGWFLCHLKDIELLKYLIKARNHLNRNGIIILKENTTFTNEKIIFQGPQKIRPTTIFEFFADLAGLKIIENKIVKNYPKKFYPLREIVLKVK